jgi:hypothetical protein
MTRIRPKRQRTVGFEALEGRLALSTGIAGPPHHIHQAIAKASQRVPASFAGRVSISGSTLNTQNLQGRIGSDRLSGYGTGSIANNAFAGGEAYLSNSKGAVELQLSPLYQIRVGKRTTRTFAITVMGATGKYAPFAASTGTLTHWNVPPRQNAVASFSGYFAV